ncbi:hypothetical protein EYZ11_012904 [Aspergillus tanneri]|uniref:Uncharacterized protein n=1 Tax=Aspergillus tanneri TaxID=1220188 RepID=A0A4S3IZI9_9EURO|nr:hypothetical protein EYZ11_012904 [Aspergillus tanneri]
MGRERGVADLCALPAHKQQIDAILRALRLESLPRYAAGYKAWTGAEGMWIRPSYNADNEEAHQALWNK